MIGSLTAFVLLALLAVPLAAPAVSLDGIVPGDHRSAEGGDRNQYRHPVATIDPEAPQRYLCQGRMTLGFRKREKGEQ